MLQWNFRFDRYGVNFKYRLFRKAGPGLIVMLPGLRAAKSQAAEYYNRLTWNDYFDTSVLYVSDPGLTPTVRGTWFQGGKGYFALERVAQDIRNIASEFSFAETQTIVYGSSQGGFAALGLGAYLTGAKILSECPQTDLRLFNMKPDTRLAAEACYDVPDMDEVPDAFVHRMNIMALYQQRGYAPRVRVLVKETDTHALDVHINPLKAAYPDRVDLRIFDGEAGQGEHSALPAETIIDEITRLRA